MKYNLSVIPIIHCVFDVVSKKSSLYLTSSRFSTMLSLRNFIFCLCILRPLIHFELFSFFYFWPCLAACRILFPNQGFNPCLLHWKHRVLTTGLQGKSHFELFFVNRIRSVSRFCGVFLFVCFLLMDLVILTPFVKTILSPHNCFFSFVDNQMTICGSTSGLFILFLWIPHCFDCCCSAAKSCLTLCDPMNCSTPGFPVFTVCWSLLISVIHFTYI